MHLTYRLNKSPEFVYGYLSDIQSFATVHPIIYRIDDNGDGTFKVFEKIKLPLFTHRFSYNTDIHCQRAERIIIMNAVMDNGITVRAQFEILSTPQGCEVHEHVQFITRLPVKFLMKWLFKKYHRTVFRNIENA